MKKISDSVFSSIRQIGILTSDLDKFISDYRVLYGFDPDRMAIYPTDADEKTCARRIAFYNFPEVEIEVIEPVRSIAPWREFLKKHGGSIHHIQFNVDCLAKAVEVMKANDCDIIERGYSMTDPRVEFIFFDTVDKVGYVTEVVNFREFN